MVLSLDHASLEELNDYFGELCSENTYMEPAPIELGEDRAAGVELPSTSK